MQDVTSSPFVPPAKQVMLLSTFFFLQLSELDARVLDELLNDPQFMEDLLEQGIQFEGGHKDGGGEGGAANSTVVVKNPQSSETGLAIASEWSLGGNLSQYESATMKVVEGIRNSARGLFAKLSAAVESAGKYIFSFFLCLYGRLVVSLCAVVSPKLDSVLLYGTKTTRKVRNSAHLNGIEQRQY